MKRSAATLFTTAALLAAALASLRVAALPAADPTYQALRSAKPEGTGVAVKDLVLTRDVLRLRFAAGTFHFLPAVDGRVVGAVFSGSGGWELTPATEVERRRLRVVTEEKELKVLSDSFEKVVLLFTDGTADEVRAAATSAAAGDAKPEAAWERFLKHEKKDLHTNFHVRLLADVLEKTDPKEGAFYAFVDGKKRPEGILAVDPRGFEFVGLGSDLGGESALYLATEERRSGFWYLAHRAAGPPAAPPAEAIHYVLDTTIRKNTDLEGTALVRATVLRPGLRVLPFRLSGRLRLQETAFAKGEAGAETSFTPLPFVQEAAKEDADPAVVFPEPLATGDVVTLKLVYKGDEVLENAGGGNYSVGRRSSWYPNLGTFTDLATFDLTYRVPKKNEVVSVGTLVESKVEADLRVSRFRSDRPLRVAGFNYGVFKKLEKSDPDSGMKVVVYTNPGRPDFAVELQDFLIGRGFDTEKLADAALVDGFNSARTFNHFFGPLPAKEVAITQQVEWSFGQSWPGLIYLPYLAFLDSTTRAQLGLLSSDFVEQVGPHEFAHQWWGHLLGWGSYRDQWLSEGFAEFSSALVVNQTGGMPKYVDFWKKAKERILEKGRGSSVRNFEAGPVTDGWRLASDRTPGAYSALVYSKGGFVLHMLRMAMWDQKAKDPDEKFIALMKDFVATWSGKNPTTADFQRVAEKHLVPALDLTRDGKLDWFFKQWVHGTDVPRYKGEVKVEETSGGKYKLSGSITQSEVPDDFRAALPIYLEFDKGAMARLGTIVFLGATTVPVDAEIPLPKKPKRVVFNAMQDVLSRD